jgi:formylglycine-generating enzyme required for sulfatase activity
MRNLALMWVLATCLLGCGGRSAIDDIDMVFVEGGTFTMGCMPEKGDNCYVPVDKLSIRGYGRDPERPAHSVTVGDFSIGRYEITQKQWKRVMGARNNPSHFKGDSLPVENVSWNDVQEFITKLNQQTGRKYRLPTEAEWEYTARGGAKSKGYRYAGSNMNSDVAWYYDNSGDMALAAIENPGELDIEDWNRRRTILMKNNNRTHTVGTKQPNELEIYNMSGNVREWVNDWYGEYSENAKTNPQGPDSGRFRVVRGGDIEDPARSCSVFAREFDGLNSRDKSIGFRLVLDP